jgi:DNA-binding winged helix-turn-helix (wHTH) protein/tetratricopeptide (TPR) repeat protein
VDLHSRISITFGPFSLDASATRLLRDGVEVRLRPQALRALKVLLVHGGQWVRYEQMIAEAWRGTVVSQHTIDVTVGEVRRSLQEYGTWIGNRPKVGYSLDVPRSDELVRRGWHFWNLRTQDGLARAIDTFTRATAECPSDFRAFEGLSATYLALATLGLKPPRLMYQGFLEAHARAEALCGLTPELRCNRAHGLHMFERKFAEAEADFLHTIEERPTLGSAYVRLSILYGTLNRLDEALAMANRGSAADPLAPVAVTMEVVLRFWRREYDAAIILGRNALALHPFSPTVRAIYAQALEFSGRPDEALVQYQMGIATSPDLRWMRTLEGTCLAKMGRTRDALAILHQIEEIQVAEYVDGFYMAVLRQALGQSERALDELERAAEENSAWLNQLSVDPKMDSFRRHPRYERLRDRLFGGTSGRTHGSPSMRGDECA